MSLSTASQASTKWLCQQALISAGGQDIATQLRERRIGCSSINDWLPASSRFSEIVWQLMAVLAPTNVSSYFCFSVWEFVGARPLTVFPHTRSVHFLFFFSFTGPPTIYFTNIPFGHLAVQLKEEERKKCCAGTSCWSDRRPAEKRKYDPVVCPNSCFFFFFFLLLAGNNYLCDPANIYKKNRKRRNEWTGKGMPIWPQSTFLS